MTLAWEELAARTLARQFPAVAGRDAAAVERVLDLAGPVQSQTARSPFLSLAARLPGVEHHAIAAAHDDHAVVRGSNLRGTVHTSTPADHALMEVVTRLGQRALWARTLRLQDTTLEQVWAGIEASAADDWRTAAELHDHLRGWLAEHDPGAEPRLDDTQGRYLAFGHGGLLRRPLGGGWSGQGRAGYRTASAVLGDRSAVLADPDGAVDALLRRHLGCHGPASRRDLAWWSGLGLRTVDASLSRLASDLVEDDAPDGSVVVDLADAPGPVDLPGTHLLPEFDALLCAYDPKARTRFVDAAHYRRLWVQDNGLLLAPVLVDGRLTGHWRLEGSGRRRRCEVAWFAGTRRPRRSELETCLAAVAAAYDVEVTGLDVAREQPA
ncbi:Winged helix DNA-binding domain-containing protein [Nocardioides scoriae]|uniref:Winged helix DNA-binding domain-containing protein n=1 Tax=Nocardioides scoriae TaxID=642780 RepID=A0A1H1UVP3_9ACTN|nr:winged helix DNA-binding domain-containing protein [Nocardioides scoriae]SDS76341.1 Winged helix DNA-binding domain-containing protein [Nocardioides scoriae]